MPVIRNAILIILIATGFSYAATPRIVPETDLTYLGCFSADGMAYTGQSLTFNPNGNGGAGSLFISAYDALKIAEISIPTTLSNAKSFAAIPAESKATILTPETAIPIVVNTGYADIMIGGMAYMTAKGAQTGPKLWVGMYDSYNVGNNARQTLSYVSPTSLASDNQGAWYVGCNTLDCDYVNRTGRYLLEIDNDWADDPSRPNLNGKYLITGYFRGGGNNTTIGPTFYAVAPWAEGNPPEPNAVLTPIKLLEYGEFPSGSYDTTEEYNAMTPAQKAGEHFMEDWTMSGLLSLTAPAWIKAGTKHAIVIPSIKGTVGNEIYHDTNDYCRGGGGWNAFPYTHEWLWFDVDDLAAVAAGTKQPWEPQPFSRYTPTDMWAYGNECASYLRSSAYDPVTGRLFVVESDSSDNPIIHVWSVSSGAITRRASGGGTIAGSIH